MDAVVPTLPTGPQRTADLDLAPVVASHGVSFYRRILSYFRKDGLLLFALLALIWTALGVGALEPAAFAVLVDRVLAGKGHPNAFTKLLLHLLPSSKPGQVMALASIWLGLRAINETATLLREMINNRLRYNGTSRVRAELFDQYLRLSPLYHKTRPQGDAIYRVSTDSLGFFGVLDTFLGAANSLLTLFIVAAVMFLWNAKMTLIVLSLAPLLVIANAWFGRTILRTSAVSKKADSDFTTSVQRGMHSVSLIQLFGRQHTESQRFCTVLDRTISAGMSMNWQQQLFPYAQRCIYAIGYAVVLGYGGYLVYRGQLLGPLDPTPFTIGGIFAMGTYLGQIWEPLRRVTGFTADVQNNAAACARVFTVLDLIPKVKDAPDAEHLAVKPRTLELDDVVFGYEPDRPILRGLSARIEPGEMVAFVGPSGAGKSTLLSLLPRFHDPAEGRVTLDGHDLRDVHVDDVRRHVALVQQESPVVAGTVAENIAFGSPSATPGQIRRAAELAGAHQFIEAMPLGYDTPLTESGQNLSGGQRQRLAIARALLTESPILLLDEPTSGLDRHHEIRFLKTLEKLKGRYTIILVTHSLSAAAHCDRILFLEDGRITEEGTHEELLNLGGSYAALVGMPHKAVEREQTTTAIVPATAGKKKSSSGGRRA
jgi:subfamily B ATP-binding cassette protein MsbA